MRIQYIWRGPVLRLITRAHDDGTLERAIEGGIKDHPHKLHWRFIYVEQSPHENLKCVAVSYYIKKGRPCGYAFYYVTEYNVDQKDKWIIWPPPDELNKEAYRGWFQVLVTMKEQHPEFFDPIQSNCRYI